MFYNRSICHLTLEELRGDNRPMLSLKRPFLWIAKKETVNKNSKCWKTTYTEIFFICQSQRNRKKAREIYRKSRERILGFNTWVIIGEGKKQKTSPSRAWLRLNALLVLACLFAFLPACSPLLGFPCLSSLAWAPLLELPCLSSLAWAPLL